VQEYFAGMDCPFTNASLVNSRDMVASVRGVSDAVDDSGLAVEDVQDASMMDIRQERMMILIGDPLSSLH
jgi:hypothetical protein